MSRLFGFLVVLALAATIWAGPALAGPGGPNHAGDPEIPNTTYLWDDDATSSPAPRVLEKAPDVVPGGAVHRNWLGRIMEISLRLARLLPR
jgi:hypothetical protein